MNKKIALQKHFPSKPSESNSEENVDLTLINSNSGGEERVDIQVNNLEATPKDSDFTDNASSKDSNFADIGPLDNNQHVSSKPSIRYYCKKCNKCFFKKGYAEKHCIEKKPWTCPKCFQDIAQAKNIKRHQEACNRHLNHSRKNSRDALPCDLCEKSFPNKFNLDRHKTQVHQVLLVRSFKCMVENCSFSSNTLKHLKRHKTLKHTDIDDRIPCSKCDGEFLSRQGLLSHITNVHGFSCNLCQRSCSTEAKLRQHIQRDHVSNNEIDDMSSSQLNVPSSDSPQNRHISQPPNDVSSHPSNVLSSQPSNVLSSQSPSMLSSQPPSMLSSQPLVVHSNYPPSEHSSQPHSVHSSQSPSMLSSQPPNMLSSMPLNVSSSQPEKLQNSLPIIVVSRKIGEHSVYRTVG